MRHPVPRCLGSNPVDPASHHPSPSHHQKDRIVRDHHLVQAVQCSEALVELIWRVRPRKPPRQGRSVQDLATLGSEGLRHPGREGQQPTLVAHSDSRRQTFRRALLRWVRGGHRRRRRLPAPLGGGGRCCAGNGGAERNDHLAVQEGGGLTPIRSDVRQVTCLCAEADRNLTILLMQEDGELVGVEHLHPPISHKRHQARRLGLQPVHAAPAGCLDEHPVAH
mmetsp:Transcript_8984/g.24991  ORF Transcript_8984/g.24991 Transcript_8984/m.24991 type:complete len:222 (-) Transcript_8984:167-832(-)